MNSCPKTFVPECFCSEYSFPEQDRIVFPALSQYFRHYPLKTFVKKCNKKLHRYLIPCAQVTLADKSRTDMEAYPVALP